MNLQAFLMDELMSPDGKRRLRAAYILGAVDEVAALDALTTQYKAEAEPPVRDAILWAGRRLRRIEQSGYTTLEAVLHHFNILSSAESGVPSAEEQRLIDELTHQIQMNTLSQEQRSGAIRTLASAALLPPMFSLPMLMLSGMSASKPLDRAEALQVIDGRPVRGRSKPTPPSDTPIAGPLRRLSATTDTKQRAALCIDLGYSNNPAALPTLSALLVADHPPEVHDAAYRAAKMIYLNVMCWQWEQDGTIDRELERRGLSLTAEPPAEEPSTPAGGDAANPEMIARILKSAEEKRSRHQQSR